MVSQAMRSTGWERNCCLNEAMTVNEIFQVGKIAFIDGTYNLQVNATRESRTEQLTYRDNKEQRQVSKQGESQHKMLSSTSSFLGNTKDPSQKLIHGQCIEQAISTAEQALGALDE